MTHHERLKAYLDTLKKNDRIFNIEIAEGYGISKSQLSKMLSGDAPTPKAIIDYIEETYPHLIEDDSEKEARLQLRLLKRIAALEAENKKLVYELKDLTTQLLKAEQSKTSKNGDHKTEKQQK